MKGFDFNGGFLLLMILGSIMVALCTLALLFYAP